MGCVVTRTSPETKRVFFHQQRGSNSVSDSLELTTPSSNNCNIERHVFITSQLHVVSKTNCRSHTVFSIGSSPFCPLCLSCSLELSETSSLKFDQAERKRSETGALFLAAWCCTTQEQASILHSMHVRCFLFLQFPDGVAKRFCNQFSRPHKQVLVGCGPEI